MARQRQPGLCCCHRSGMMLMICCMRLCCIGQPAAARSHPARSPWMCSCMDCAFVTKGLWEARRPPDTGLECALH